MITPLLQNPRTLSIILGLHVTLKRYVVWGISPQRIRFSASPTCFVCGKIINCNAKVIALGKDYSGISHMKMKRIKIYNALSRHTFVSCYVCCCDALNKTLSRCNLKRCLVCVLFLLVFTVVKYSCIVLLRQNLKYLDSVLFHLTFQKVLYLSFGYTILSFWLYMLCALIGFGSHSNR